MTVMETNAGMDALKALAKSKNPTLYVVKRDGGTLVYLLPPKKRELECVPNPDGDPMWPAKEVAKLREMLPQLVDLKSEDFTWVRL
jgi:hypothetical protein